MAGSLSRTQALRIVLLGWAVLRVVGHAQLPAPASPPIPNASPATAPQQPDDPGKPAQSSKPLPDVVALMRDVEINQRKAEAVEKDYIYHSVETAQEVDGNGNTKKTTVSEYDHYWLSGVRVRRLVAKNGKSLTGEELAREDEKIQKEVVKAKEKREKGDVAGKETDSRGNEEITVSRLLELGSFSNARRLQLNGRDTIAVDYVGDAKARTRNRAEDAIRDLQGTAWIDEKDHILARAEGRFINAFKVGGGLLVNIRKGTHFAMEQTKVNGEVWLPANISAQGAARFLLFFNFNGNIQAAESDYRKFRTTSTILPGTTKVETPD